MTQFDGHSSNPQSAIPSPQFPIRNPRSNDKIAPALANQDTKPEGPASIEWGSAWAESAESLLALVPSSIVTEEWNVLINPAHPDMELAHAERRRPFHYDLRLGES